MLKMRFSGTILQNVRRAHETLSFPDIRSGPLLLTELTLILGWNHPQERFRRVDVENAVNAAGGPPLASRTSTRSSHDLAVNGG